MKTRPLLVTALLLMPAVVGAQAPIEILGREGSVRVPGDAGVEAPTGPADCAAESWTFEVSLPSATLDPPTVWAAAGFSCSEGERSPSVGTCLELCGPSRNVCTGSLAAGSGRYRFSIPTRFLVDPREGRCLAASGRRAVFLLVRGEVVALSPRRVRYDLLPPAPPRAVDVNDFEDRVEVRWSYGSTGAGAVDAGASDSGLADAGGTDAAVADAGSTTTGNGGEEPVARFHVLCDPPLGGEGSAPDAGSSCGTGALDTLDVRDDAALARHRCAEPTPPGARSAALSRVRNLARYRIGVVAEDLAGNRSVVAQSGRCAAPRALTDFWEGYRAAEGRGRPWACTVEFAPGGGGGALLVLLAALVRVRRGRATRGPVG